MYKAILFDFDGTTAKTMEDNFQAWKHVLKEYGVDLLSEEYFPYEGMNLLRLSEKFYTDLDNPIELVEKKEEYYIKHNNFMLYDGVEELLRLLIKKGIKTGLVTSGLKNRLIKTVPQYVFGFFNVEIYGDEGGEKPSPLPYLTAAAKLRVYPHECLVIENAPPGIESAKNAGMFCIAIASTLDKKYLNKADIIVDKFSEIKNLDIIK
ncbi:MAG: HAD family phosphatase, partial [Clostridia bacterium]